MSGDVTLTDAERETLGAFISEHLFGYRDGPYMNHEAMAATLLDSAEFRRIVAARIARGDA